LEIGDQKSEIRGQKCRQWNSFARGKAVPQGGPASRSAAHGGKFVSSAPGPTLSTQCEGAKQLIEATQHIHPVSFVRFLEAVLSKDILVCAIQRISAPFTSSLSRPDARRSMPCWLSQSNQV